MSTTKICTSLPKKVIDDLRSNKAIFHEDCKMIIIDLLDSNVSKPYDDFLLAAGLVDPILTPHFGNPAAVYIPFNVQLEVYQLLATYKPLLKDNFADGADPVQLVQDFNIPAGGGFQYHHAKFAIHKVIQQIENPNTYFQLRGLNNVTSGSTICDLAITYANCQIVRRLRKF